MQTVTVHRKRPPQVVRAILKNDSFALQAMGTEGARISNMHQDVKREIKLLAQEALERELEKKFEYDEPYSGKVPKKRNLTLELELQKMAKEANEDICPVD